MYCGSINAGYYSLIETKKIWMIAQLSSKIDGRHTATKLHTT